MLPAVKSSNPQTSFDAIEAFERDRGVSLPERYISFLLSTNGGIPESPVFPITGMADNPDGLVQVFYGINARISTSDLAKVYDQYKGGIPTEVVAIACTGFDDFICLDLRNDQERVVFWDKRHFWGTGEWRERDLFHIANSFDEFLMKLRPQG